MKPSGTSTPASLRLLAHVVEVELARLRFTAVGAAVVAGAVVVVSSELVSSSLPHAAVEQPEGEQRGCEAK